jgi:hypothetical protein
MKIEFTAHNVRLDDGTLTMPDEPVLTTANAWFVSARRVLETVFPGEKRHLRLADLGCLEGGYAVEFARMGFRVLGVEVRDSNIAACAYLKSKINLPNLEFVKDDALNIASHGLFDAVFCCGLLYHLDRPRQFLQTLSSVTTRVVILQTHFSPGPDQRTSPWPRWMRRLSGKAAGRGAEKFRLSPICENEGLPGRWYPEFADDKAFSKRDSAKWSSWDNRRSFWIQREYLLQTIQDVGFDLVLEQYDSLGSGIADSMLGGYYAQDCRGTFIGIKTGKATNP